MTEDERPDPEELLARVQADLAKANRGKLTIFFGASPGVGKTYAMLEAARLEREAGRDVAIGLVETHGRYDTGALVLGHELLPRRKITHRGIDLEEFDLDAALARKPALLLVDELAHTNAEGSRHKKRWQDVEELLVAGIDVFTTLNVQHLESLRDVVAQVTGVVVKESVPDRIFEGADDVRILDLPIDELLERLQSGKVYGAAQAAQAQENFFRPGNLIALRELALRVTAQRVDAEMRRYRDAQGIDRTWPVGERLLVSVSASPASERLIRSARRLAAGLHCDWIAAYVETPAALGMTASDKARLAHHMDLARALGGEPVTLAAERGPEAIVRFARTRNVTRILVGKPTHARWRDRLRAPFLDELVRLSGDIDVHVLSGEPLDGRPRAGERRPKRRGASPSAYGASVLIVVLATLVSDATFGKTQLADVAMVYLLGVVLVALRWGLGPSLTAAVAAVLALDFFFVPPYLTFAVADLRHVVTFAVMFVVAAVTSGLTARVRGQADAARERELRTASLYALTRKLAAAKAPAEVLALGAEHIVDVFGVRVAAWQGKSRDAGAPLVAVALGAAGYEPDEREQAVAEWVWKNGGAAGNTTDTLPSSRGLYVSLESPTKRLAVLGVLVADESSRMGADERPHLDAFLVQIAAALARATLAEEAAAARREVVAEQLRNALLSSVSHDLRTPLAVITGTASTLLDERLAPAARRELTESILLEAERLHRLVRNLLDMTRLEAGEVRIAREWQPLEEAVGAALGRTRSLLGGRTVSTNLSAELPLVPYDSLLMQQLLVNLLENVAKYTPDDSAVEIRATFNPSAGERGEVEVVVADRGKGLEPGDEAKVFEKFYRAEPGPGIRAAGGGVGLGLTIARGIVEAHGGRIWAKNRDGGGAEFGFTVPIVGEPPVVEAER